MLTLVAPTLTPLVEPTATPTMTPQPTPLATPTAGRTPGTDLPRVTPSISLPTPTPTPTFLALVEEPTATPTPTPDLMATATAQAVLSVAQNALDQFGSLPTPTPDSGLPRPLPTELQLFEPLPQFQQTDELPPSRNADPALEVGVAASVLPGMNTVLRTEPGFGVGEIIGYLTDGDIVLIADGPLAVAGDADTIVWWFVETADGARGWTPANTSQFTLLEAIDEEEQ